VRIFISNHGKLISEWNTSQAEFEEWLVMNIAAARFIFHDTHAPAIACIVLSRRGSKQKSGSGYC
jgi:hypothetical protein